MAEEIENTEEPPASPAAEADTEAAATPTDEQEALADEAPAEGEPLAPEPVAAAEPADEAEPLPSEAPAEEGPAAPAAPAQAEAEPSAPGQPEPEPKKRKRLPRALRPRKGRRVHVPATERKAIVRLPKPEHERGRRQERRGVVVSNAMDKTIVVKVDLIKSHPKYKKVVRRSVKFHAHDEQNAANVGDVVRIVETRPLSATKRWRLAEIVEVAK